MREKRSAREAEAASSACCSRGDHARRAYGESSKQRTVEVAAGVHREQQPGTDRHEVEHVAQSLEIDGIAIRDRAPEVCALPARRRSPGSAARRSTRRGWARSWIRSNPVASVKCPVPSGGVSRAQNSIRSVRPSASTSCSARSPTSSVTSSPVRSPTDATDGATSLGRPGSSDDGSAPAVRRARNRSRSAP